MPTCKPVTNKMMQFPLSKDIQNVQSPAKSRQLSLFWRRKWQPTPVFLPGESHGWRGLVGYSLWGCKELDTTQQLTHTQVRLVFVVVVLTAFSLMELTGKLETQEVGLLPSTIVHWKLLMVSCSGEKSRSVPLDPQGLSSEK